MPSHHRKLSRGQIRRSLSVAPNEAERHRCLLGSRSAVAVFSKICMSTADSLPVLNPRRAVRPRGTNPDSARFGERPVKGPLP
jgi:hypothetical protein